MEGERDGVREGERWRGRGRKMQEKLKAFSSRRARSQTQRQEERDRRVGEEGERRRFQAADDPRNHRSRYSRQRGSFGVIMRNEKNRSRPKSRPRCSTLSLDASARSLMIVLIYATRLDMPMETSPLLFSPAPETRPELIKNLIE